MNDKEKTEEIIINNFVPEFSIFILEKINVENIENSWKIT